MQPNWLPDWLSWILEWMHQEQALVAGLLALAGAVSTVIVVRKQIGLQEEQWRIERENREKATRAKLPIALSEIVDYCNDAYSHSSRAFFQFENVNTAYEPLNPPALPKDSIEVLAKFIEHSSNELVSKAMQELLREVQVVHARVSVSLSNFRSGQLRGINNRRAYADRAADAELLRVQTEQLFEYARQVRNGPRPWKTVADAETSFFFGRERNEFNNLVWRSVSMAWPNQE